MGGINKREAQGARQKARAGYQQSVLPVMPV
jgi:hypothetical protein